MATSETLGQQENKSAASAPQRTFRAAALDRAASPEQLDHLVVVTKSGDWIITLVLIAALAAVLTWGVFGRVPSRVSGEGILISSGGRVVDAVSAAAGRLQSVAVVVGDHVTEGQPIAQIAQTDIEQKHSAAVEVLHEREVEYNDIKTKAQSELAAKGSNFEKLEAALKQVIKATSQRIEFLAVDVKNLEDLLAKGYTTRRTMDERRREYTDAQQRLEDTQNEILKIRSQRTDLETQREREIQQAEFKLNEARRQMNALAEQLSQNTQVLSPIEGRVLEVKISPGSVLSVGTPVIAIETEGQKLQAVVYIAAEHGKQIKPGMQVHLEPSTVKREEFGMMLGTITSVSDFPMTPQGIAATLHNESLVSRFTNKGAPYAAEVVLDEDASTTTGYRWAVGQGPNLHLSSGTLAKAEITTRRQRPLDLVIPLIRHYTGIDG
ncbi:NHLP bacteriocin system secretion protein [Bradyrhizobium jicamae]|uniref:NHLP bacteriocin system secretion protein n=1 Tax=Bradyrhizobium jicamae TaxID=280332 RepID=UPI001BA70DDB|nr:NHLP bacteriocin system secretion protein [Bradyrhizobium jicamae]MBR0752821.1 NHLP bacteriocin system secretion protein [Bradyrhizobium jicamae]